MVTRKSVLRRDKLRRSLRRSKRSLSKRHTARKCRRFRTSLAGNKKTKTHPTRGGTEWAPMGTVACQVPNCEEKTSDRNTGYICKFCKNGGSRSKKGQKDDTASFEDIVDCEFFRNKIFKQHDISDKPDHSVSFKQWTGLDKYNTRVHGHQDQRANVEYTLQDTFLNDCPCLSDTRIQLNDHANWRDSRI